MVAVADSQGAIPRGLAQREDGVPAPEPGGRSGYLVPAVCGFLLLAVGLVFGQTVRHEFVNLDDHQYVYKNPHVLGGLTSHAVLWAFGSSYSANWHPLTWLSHMIDCQLYGVSPGGHHVTNVVCHAVAAILLFLVLLGMTGDRWPSALAAAFFAVHPQHVESVAWVAERKDVLSGLLFVATLGAYVRYVVRPGSWQRYVTMIVCFALGLAAKPIVVTLPFVLLLLDYWPLRRWAPPAFLKPSRGGLGDGRPLPAAHLIREKVPLFALAAASCGVTLWSQGQVAAFKPAEDLPWIWRAGNALVSYVLYLGQTFCPAGLTAYYSHPGRGLPAWQIAGAVFLLLAISAAAIRRGGTAPI